MDDEEGYPTDGPGRVVDVASAGARTGGFAARWEFSEGNGEVLDDGELFALSKAGIAALLGER